MKITMRRVFAYVLVAILFSPVLFITVGSQHVHEEGEEHVELNYPMNFYFQGSSELVLTTNNLVSEHFVCPVLPAVFGGSETMGTWTSPAVTQNTTIGGSTTVVMHADGTARDLSFSASVSAGNAEIASGDSNSITLTGGQGTFTINLELPETPLGAGENIAVTLTIHAGGRSNVHFIIGEPDDLSLMTLYTPGIDVDAESDFHGEELHIHATAVHPWGLAITNATAKVNDDIVTATEIEIKDGKTIIDWHIDGARGVDKITITLVDAAGNSYTSDVHAHAHDEGGISLEGGAVGILVIVLIGIMGVGYLGGITPLLSFWKDKHMRYLLAFSAGIFLSVAVFHALPEAWHMSGMGGLAMVGVGFATLYVVEHYVIKIIDKRFKKEGHEHHHDHHTDGANLHMHDHHAADHAIIHEDDVDPSDEACTHHLHDTSEAAFAGVAFHNLVEGMVITTLLLNPETTAIGLVVLLGIILHKAPCTLSISSLMKMGGHSSEKIKKSVLILLGMTPLGAILAASLFVGVKESTIGLALGFSAGTFLEIAVLDLVPESLREKKGREWALVAITLGIILLWIFSLTEGDAHAH